MLKPVRIWPHVVRLGNKRPKELKESKENKDVVAGLVSACRLPKVLLGIMTTSQPLLCASGVKDAALS